MKQPPLRPAAPLSPGAYVACFAPVPGSALPMPFALSTTYQSSAFGWPGRDSRFCSAGGVAPYSDQSNARQALTFTSQGLPRRSHIHGRQTMYRNAPLLCGGIFNSPINRKLS